MRTSAAWAARTAVAVDLDAPVHARAVGQPPAAPAEQDAAVAGGAEVVDQRAAVGHALAAGPAELRDHVGHGLGQHDVRGGDREARAQAALGARGGADRQHDGAGLHAPRVGLAPGGPTRRTGECSKTWTPRSISRRRRPSARRAGCRVAKSGMDTARRNRGEAQRASRVGSRQREHPLGRAQRGRRLDGAHADLVEGGGRRHAQVAGLVEPGVHALGLAPRANLGHRVAGRVQQRAGRLVAEALAQRGGADSHIDSQNPPLRPLGPWPQTPLSSRATVAPRSSSSQAAHMPV